MENELHILTAKMRILHIAPEWCLFQAFGKQKNIKYVPGDKMVLGYSNQKGVKYVDLTDLDFDDGSFDCVLANHVLEHIVDDQKAMSEIYRVLKFGGAGIITVPIDETLEKTYEDPAIFSSEDREKYFGQWDHVRMYALDIKNRFENAGFNVALNRYAETFSEEDRKKYGLKNDIIIHLSKI